MMHIAIIAMVSHDTHPLGSCQFAMMRIEYTYSTISASKATIEADLLKELQELFKTETIESVLVNMVIQ